MTEPAQEAVAQVLRNFRDDLLTDAGPDALLSEWLVISQWTDSGGETTISVLPSPHQLRSHTVGLLEMAREDA